MDTNPEHGITPPQPQSEKTLGIRQRFPGEMAPPSQAQAPVSVGGSNTFSRVVLPLLLFILVIGAIAWVTQYMPARKKIDAPVISNAGAEPTLRFDEVKSIWDPSDKDYIAEFEIKDDGHFDFPFTNPLDDGVFVGAMYLSCVCSEASVALLPTAEEVDVNSLKWQKLDVSTQLDPKNAVKVAPQGRGLVRLGWKGGKLKDSLSRIHAALWTQPVKQPKLKQRQDLETVVRIVPPVMFDPNIARVGDIVGGSVNKMPVMFWSATRPEINLVVKSPEEDGLIDVQLTPLSKEEQAELEEKLRTRAKSPINTRIKCAYRGDITVYEQKGSRQLPQGPFGREMVILADEEKVPGLVVAGIVQGEVQIASSEAGTLKLDRFMARDGARKRVTLWTEKNVGLTFESQRPAYMRVRLSENKTESTSNRRRWELDIEIPPGTPVGPLPTDSAVILKTQSASPRQIYIPIRGSATPG